MGASLASTAFELDKFRQSCGYLYLERLSMLTRRRSRDMSASLVARRTAYRFAELSIQVGRCTTLGIFAVYM